MKALTFIVVLLAACDKPPSPASTVVDQCLRRDLFTQCMASLPKGPEHANYNDWDEVVTECGHQAYYMAVRERLFVKDECRVER